MAGKVVGQKGPLIGLQRTLDGEGIKSTVLQSMDPFAKANMADEQRRAQEKANALREAEAARMRPRQFSGAGQQQQKQGNDVSKIAQQAAKNFGSGTAAGKAAEKGAKDADEQQKPDAQAATVKKSMTPEGEQAIERALETAARVEANMYQQPQYEAAGPGGGLSR